MARRKNFPNRIETRRNEAKARQEAYDKLTPQQKLVRLTTAGITSGKHYNKLIARIHNEK